MPVATRAFPWDQAMTFGLGVLKIAPEQFWRMTPRELAAAMHGSAGRTGMPIAAPLRRDLDALLIRFPDTQSRG